MAKDGNCEAPREHRKNDQEAVEDTARVRKWVNLAVAYRGHRRQRHVKPVEPPPPLYVMKTGRADGDHTEEEHQTDVQAMEGAHRTDPALRGFFCCCIVCGPAMKVKSLQAANVLGEYWARRKMVFRRAVTGPAIRHRQTAQIVFEEYEKADEEFPGLDEFGEFAVSKPF